VFIYHPKVKLDFPPENTQKIKNNLVVDLLLLFPKIIIRNYWHHGFNRHINCILRATINVIGNYCIDYY
jgi:hypothetical protein